ncbi:MAG: hypothetical protein A2Z04_07685 [Chloroflexi bacterium RBG_16_57_9]|nr:MAG: hypothetical protein A2Z04_07685 [Chloroflexi bacterium RBG_16_57_9]
MMGFGIGGFGFVFMLLFWIGIVALAIGGLSVLFPRTGTASQGTVPPRLSAREILDTRYARGELTRAQYEQMVQDIH